MRKEILIQILLSILVLAIFISVYQKYSFESEIEVFLEEAEKIQSPPLEIENLPD